MNRFEIDALVEQLRNGNLSRRGFMRRATALGLSGAAAGILARNAVAQDATPAASPAGTGEVTTSVTREEFNAALREAYQFEEPASTGGQLIHTMTTDIATVNPILVSDTYSNWITGFVFEGLVGGSPVDGTDTPGLADYWEIGADGVTYTFYLTKDAKWHDGEPVTADDIIFSFDAVLAEDSLSVRKSTVEQFLKEYKKIDDYTVQLVAKSPSAVFVANTAGQFQIVPKHIWEGVPFGEWNSDPGSTGQDPSRVIGSGPFKFVEWALGDHVTLTKNADYWDQENLPVIDEYTYRVVADASSALASLQTGESDVAEVPFSQANPLRESNPELQVNDFDTLAFNFYITNQDASRSDLFTDVKVRQALHYALDRDLIAQTVYQGFAIRADGTQPVLSVAYAPDRINTIYLYDPEKSKSLLDEAGWVAGSDGIREKDGVRLSFECTYAEASATYEQQIPYMQQAWREVGIEMIPAAIPFPTLLDNNDAGNYQMSVLGFTWSVDGLQGDMFRCSAVPPAGFNMMRYCNEDYDKLDAASQVELDDQKRIDILIEASNIVNDEMAAGINVFRKSIYGGSPRVHNFFPNGYSNVWWVQYAWVEQG
ncbi:MAG TPA: ABC transporter substrate-binding protein [Thermomicrobiales bacterium]|nr:ABC transporter substrate-binding protein [Thermomicrobiales bacterium]